MCLHSEVLPSPSATHDHAVCSNHPSQCILHCDGVCVPKENHTAGEQCSSCMHIKHTLHCQLHAYHTHATLSAACIPNTCIIVSCMHTEHMQHCQLHACRKKFLIEILEGTKVISRKKGFTTTTCVSGVAIGQQTKQFDNLPESAKVLSRL